MSNAFHRDMGQVDNHIIHSFEYANAAARTGATGMVPSDIGRVARQTDDDSFYVLIDDSPVTWQAFITTDVKAAIDSGGAADFIGAASNDGLLRTADGLSYVDGGDFVTLEVDPNNATDTVIAAGDEILFADASDTNAVKKDTVQGILDLVTTLNDMHFSFFSQSHIDGLQIKETTTYVFSASFIFRGTTVLGTPTNIKVITDVQSAANAGFIKIFDSTNSLQIAELTGITDIVPTLKDLGTLANLPTGEAIFEIQGKLTTNSKGQDLHIKALSVYF